MRNFSYFFGLLLVITSFASFVIAFLYSRENEYAKAAYFMSLSVSLQISSWRMEKTTVTVNMK